MYWNNKEWNLTELDSKWLSMEEEPYTNIFILCIIAGSIFNFFYFKFIWKEEQISDIFTTKDE